MIKISVSAGVATLFFLFTDRTMWEISLAKSWTGPSHMIKTQRVPDASVGSSDINLNFNLTTNIWWRKRTFCTTFLSTVLDRPYFCNIVTSFTWAARHESWLEALVCKPGETLGSFPAIDLHQFSSHVVHFVSVSNAPLSDSKVVIIHTIVGNCGCYASGSK